MYNAQITKERIKSLCKNKKIIMENMLLECSLGANAIRQINDKKGMASFSLAKIADYLDCSVDYLLGRDDTPQITNTGDITNGVIGHINAPVNIGNNQTRQLTTQEQDLLRIYNSVDGKKQMKIMNLIYQIEDEMKENNKQQLH